MAAWEWQGLTYPNPAVGAAAAYKGEIIAISAHRQAGGPHAEVLLLKECFLRLSHNTQAKERLASLEDAADIHRFLLNHPEPFYRELHIAVTLEPCNHHGKTPPCAELIEALKPARLAIGCSDPTPAGGGCARLEAAGVAIVRGVLEDRCHDLLEPFLRWRGEGFRLFKLAQSLNGVIGGGIISGEASRDYVHRLRERIDLLVVGGETVRCDRPILDARRTGGRPPDLLIYSRHDDFDRTIPLFGVAGRQVWIEHELRRLQLAKFAMIEGGGGMLRATRELVDWYLIFIAPRFMEGLGYHFSQKCAILHTRRIGDDLMIWARRI